MNISLIGYRGVGKSTLGKLLARKLNMDFIDTDVVIESKIGMNIVDYFQNNTEKSFREIESAVIRRVMRNNQNIVISLGGGAILDKKNIFEIKSNSKVVFLDAKKELLVHRLSNNKRPALTNLPLGEEINLLIKQRYPLYKQCADVAIKVFNSGKEKLLFAIENALHGLNNNFTRNEIHFEGNELQPYNIEIQRGAFRKLAHSIDPKRKYLIICDSNIEELYATDLKVYLYQQGITSDIVTFPAGEENKNLATFSSLHEQIDQSFDRKSCIIAFGGGVTGDLAGFVASTFLRGISFIQIPTSLLSMVDSSIGGKLGVNSSRGKNRIGVFNNPNAVYVDPLFLHTLPQEFFIEGFAEVIKHALIMSKSYFNFLIDNSTKIFNLNTEILLQLIEESVKIKLHFVEKDEKESNQRRKLNFGHTVGHALEKALDYKDITHGSAVSIGMVAAAYISFKRKMITSEIFEKIKESLVIFGLPLHLSDLGKKTTLEIVLTNLDYDKKRVAEKHTFILLEKIGTAVVVDNLTQEEITGAINYVI